MKVVLIGNYGPQEQESMQRFVLCLEKELIERDVQVEVLSPQPRITRLLPLRGSGGKWLGYLDRFVFFPRRLRMRARRDDPDTVYHVCDHSNAMYLSQVGHRRHVVTCHDLLAIRGALGDRDSFCEASATGKMFQRWIRTSLGRARVVTCDSKATLTDFQRLYPDFAGRSLVLPMGLNSPYRPVDPSPAWIRLTRFNLETRVPFILVVGSNHFRKNRDGALRILKELGSRFSGKLVFAGQKLSVDQRELACALGVESRVVELGSVTNSELEALYSMAHGLLFPSRAEGFGWPVLEAQACGCPVVCSNRTSIPEVAGAGAFVHDLADEAGFAESIGRLLDPMVRADLRRKGFTNATRMTTEKMVDDYVGVYRSLLGAEGGGRRAG